jgi:hypothetical protein
MGREKEKRGDSRGDEKEGRGKGRGRKIDVGRQEGSTDREKS